MTDLPSSPTDPEDDDLLASLYLDGEASSADRARVEADPRLMARVRSFEAIAIDLSSVTPPPELRSTQIAAALDLFDQQPASSVMGDSAHVAPESGASSPKVSSLTERRERKQARGIPTWLGAAAAAALVVGGLGFAATLGGGDDDSSDAAMDAASDPAASSTNRDNGQSLSTEAASSEPTIAADSDAMEEETAEAATDQSADDAGEEADDAMEDDAMEDDAPAADGDFDDSELADTGPRPIPLDGLQATTAAEYLDLLGDQPLQPIAGSPCAESPLVKGLFGVDSFLPVVFDGVVASLLVQEGVPSTAVIVGPTCAIELE